MNKRTKQCSKCLPSKNNIIIVLTFDVLHDVCINSASLLINVSMAAVFVVRHKTFICRISSRTYNMMNKTTKQCSKCLPSNNNLVTVLTFHVLHDVCMNSANLLINVSMAAVFVVRAAQNVYLPHIIAHA